MSLHDDEFDDPALRSAVRRATAGPSAAPPALRRRVEALLGAGSAALQVTTQPARRGWPRWMGSSPAKTLVAATACFLAIGVAVMQFWATFGPQPGPTPVARVAFPVSAAVEMIRTHDNCAKLPDHHLVPGDDPTLVLHELTHMPSAPITPINLAGWQFKGAGTCTVGQTQGAHLLFARDNDRISIFSLPAPRNCGHGTSALYREAVDGHAVAGFVFGGSVYGVVGSGSSGQAMLTQIDALTSQVENCVGASSCEGLGAGR